MQTELPIRASSYSRRLHVTTLLRIRWLVLSCQTMAVLFVGLYLGFPLPFGTCIVLISLSAWLNLYLTFHYPFSYRLGPLATTFILGFDILQLAALLFLTGGLQNPFALLIVGPAIVSAASLKLRYIIVLNFLVVLCVTILSIKSLPLPWYPGETISQPRLITDGVWTAIVVALIFFTNYAYRFAEEARRLADAFTATELVLQRENHLSSLDGLAAAAAHELGTPLATIQLVAKEMDYALKSQPEFKEDIELLSSQIARCRDILKHLTSLSTNQNDDIYNMPVTSLIEEIVAPHRDFGIHIEMRQETCTGEEPMLRRNPGILFGLGNLIENAVDFARSEVIVSYCWTEQFIRITIIDNGPGYTPAILDRIGEPYTTSRVADQHGGGLGLGLFIAKTLLERSGAQLYFANSDKKNYGAEVRLQWQRRQLEI